MKSMCLSQIGCRNLPLPPPRNSLLLYPFERFFDLVCQFFNLFHFLSRFSKSTFVESVLSTSAFNSAASWQSLSTFFCVSLRFSSSIRLCAEDELGKLGGGSSIGCGLRGNSCGWPMGSPAAHPATAPAENISSRNIRRVFIKVPSSPPREAWPQPRSLPLSGWDEIAGFCGRGSGSDFVEGKSSSSDETRREHK